MHRKTARTLSAASRDLLIQHVDRPLLIRATVNGTARKHMIRMGILKGCDREGTPKIGHLMRYTMLTERGRAVLSSILAEYAEGLILAGCLSPSALPVSLVPSQCHEGKTHEVHQPRRDDVRELARDH